MIPNARREYPKLLAAYALSTAGDAGVGMFLAWVTLERRGPAAMSGVFIGSAAACVFGPAVGKALDRSSVRNVLTGSSLSRAILMCVLGLMAPETVARYAPLFAFLCAFFNLAHGPTVAKSIPALFPPERMHRANAASSAAFLIASAAGPALGGAVLEHFGPRAPIALFAAGFLLSAPLSWTIHFPKSADAAERSTAEFNDASPLRALFGNSTVLTLVALGIGLNFALAPINVALAPMMMSMGSGPEGFGYAMALFVVGALLGNLAIGKLSHTIDADWAIICGLGTAGISLAAVGLSQSPTQAAVSVLLIGVALPFFQVNVATRLQRSIPAARAGQMFATINSVTLVSAPLAAAGTGLLLKRLAPFQLFFGASLLCAALGMAWAAIPRLYERDSCAADLG